jgi:hypothetical protein
MLRFLAFASLATTPDPLIEVLSNKISVRKEKFPQYRCCYITDKLVQRLRFVMPDLIRHPEIDSNCWIPAFTGMTPISKWYSNETA